MPVIEVPLIDSIFRNNQSYLITEKLINRDFKIYIISSQTASQAARQQVDHPRRKDLIHLPNKH